MTAEGQMMERAEQPEKSSPVSKTCLGRQFPRIFLSLQEVRDYILAPLNLSARMSLSLFTCHAPIHTETNAVDFFGVFSICYFSAFLVGKTIQRSQELWFSNLQFILNITQQPGFSKRANLISSEVLSCQKENCRVSQIQSIGYR